jgi:CrcB protein
VTWVAVAVGGALGSMARFAVQLGVERVTGRAVPGATAIVNIGGCFVIGLLAGALAGDRLQLSSEMRAFVFVGLLGGFTTFSSFGLDTLVLVQEGRAVTAATNVAVQLAVGFLGLYGGYAMMRGTA